MFLRCLSLALLALLLTGCASRLNLENYSRIEVGMHHSEVLDLLGTPDNCWALTGFTSCSWSDGHRAINVRFVNDRVLLHSGDGLL